MSRKYNIRWSENDSEALRKAVKNFNAKVSRLEKKYGDSDVILPEKVSVKQMRELVTTRRDLQRELKSLQRFTQRGSETVITIPNTDNNIQMTRWQRDEMSKRAAIINRKRTLRRKDIEARELERVGQKLGYTRGDIGMGRADELVLRPTSAFTPKMRAQDIGKKMEHLMRESQSTYWEKRDLIMRESFLKALEQNFNAEDIKGVREAIMNMPIEEFKEKLLSNPEDFSTAYPPDDEEYVSYLNELKATWLPETKHKQYKAKKPATNKKYKVKKTKKNRGKK